ncbi:MAG: hypothetical protein KGQ95_00595 [Acidobacteria bacterium]|nr:hypothetical protein [Acidobacteriota bacterium]
MNRPRVLATLTTSAVLAAALLVGTGAASGNSSNWGSNGSATCSAVETPAETMLGPLNAANGQFCTQAVSGWIGISFDGTSYYMQSCSAAGSSWSLDGQSLVQNGPWWYAPVPSWWGRTGNNIGWQGSSNGFTAEAYGNEAGTDQPGYWAQGQGAPSYGQSGAGVTFWGNGSNLNGSSWQMAVGCLNNVGAQCWVQDFPPDCGGVPPNNLASVTSLFTESERRPGTIGVSPPERRAATAASARPTRPAESRNLRSFSRDKSRALVVSNLNPSVGRARTAVLTCPTGYVRTGRVNHEYVMWTPGGRAPRWRDHSRVITSKSRIGASAARVTVSLTRAVHPTQVQVQLSCVRA